ncbi:unnamed protein product [Gadus morhua 'NCC']
MPLYSDISGTETGKCTDCTKLRQTVALMETRLAALEKCKGSLQDTVPMESTNEPATHAPLSPEMRPDGQCGQRRNMNQSPWRGPSYPLTAVRAVSAFLHAHIQYFRDACTKSTSKASTSTKQQNEYPGIKSV